HEGPQLNRINRPMEGLVTFDLRSKLWNQKPALISVTGEDDKRRGNLTAQRDYQVPGLADLEETDLEPIILQRRSDRPRAATFNVDEVDCRPGQGASLHLANARRPQCGQPAGLTLGHRFSMMPALPPAPRSALLDWAGQPSSGMLRSLAVCSR